ncbi:transmembrane protein 202 isoform X3 [Mastomys coucha]|uniref:transmembrane protein 202 isoform X3 n=1 Tax=Mastomys coucha TaxID=35658 RepID=UPI00126239B5|nr:transmembrane protein 202 isoform X3 [Mastomys coucha]
MVEESSHKANGKSMQQERKVASHMEATIRKMKEMSADDPQPMRGATYIVDYLQYSRALFIISSLFMLIALGLLLSSCRPAERMASSGLDLKVSMLSFCSAVSLLLCLSLFLAQVEWYTKSAMEYEFLWTYYLNWFCEVLYICVGIISFLNYITFQPHPPDGSVNEDLWQKSRLNIGPVPKTLLARAEMSHAEMQFLSGRQEELQNVRKGKLATTRL